MAWNTPDVYYQPEKFELTPVAEIDYSDGNYNFDIRAVWKHANGTLYTARDSGCSCPSPFEDYTSLDTLEVADFSKLEREAECELNDKYSNTTQTEVFNYLNKVRVAS